MQCNYLHLAMQIDIFLITECQVPTCTAGSPGIEPTALSPKTRVSSHLATHTCRQTEIKYRVLILQLENGRNMIVLNVNLEPRMKTVKTALSTAGRTIFSFR